MFIIIAVRVYFNLKKLCFRLVVEVGEPQQLFTFTSFVIMVISTSNVIRVPVRPIPALQWTTSGPIEASCVRLINFMYCKYKS